MPILDTVICREYGRSMFPSATRQLAFNFGITRPKPKAEHHELSSADVATVQQKRVASYLSMALQESVDVVFTDNRATMISYKKKGGVLALRLHKMFQHADETVLKALSVFVRGIPSPGASRRLDEFIKSNQELIRKRTGPRRLPVHPEGEYIHLKDVLERVSNRYFAGATADVNIGWGRMRERRRKGRRARTRSRALATYCFEDTTIRVSPVLDSARVPDFIIDWVVYHELLHHILPVERSGNKKRYHTAKFRALERAFPHYEEALRWEQQNLDWLLS